jgi:6-phosphofructokinase 1
MFHVSRLCAVLHGAAVPQVTAAIVTCGGLCPGLNDVVQNIVFTLTDYGVPEDQILGIRYGLRGFYEREDKPVTLTRRMVEGIHLKGGTMLVSSSSL